MNYNGKDNADDSGFLASTSKTLCPTLLSARASDGKKIMTINHVGACSLPAPVEVLGLSGEKSSG